MFSQKNAKARTEARDRIRRRLEQLVLGPATIDKAEQAPAGGISENSVIRRRVDELLRKRTTADMGAASPRKNF